MENNIYMIIHVDENIKEGNNASVRYIHDDIEFIEWVSDSYDYIEKFIVIKNNNRMTPYDCKRELKVHEDRVKLWSSYDPFGVKSK